MAQDLRKATAVSQGNYEIRFTQDRGNFSIYYLYNPNVTYPLTFSDPSLLYQVRKAALSGNITSNFTYGSGNIIINDVLPPTNSTSPSNLSVSGNITTIDLSVARNGEIIRSKTQAMSRNTRCSGYDDGTYCWYEGLAPCATTCAPHGGCAAGNWNDTPTCTFCKHQYSWIGSCLASTNTAAPMIGPNGPCYYRDASIPAPDCAVAPASGYDRLCACVY